MAAQPLKGQLSSIALPPHRNVADQGSNKTRSLQVKLHKAASTQWQQSSTVTRLEVVIIIIMLPITD
jgi:hypothetical protein